MKDWALPIEKTGGFFYGIPKKSSLQNLDLPKVAGKKNKYFPNGGLICLMVIYHARN